MRVLLLNPPFTPYFSRSSRSPATTKGGTIYYPIYLSYATGVLEREGFEVKLVDAPARGYNLKKVLKIAKKFNPDLIVVDTSTPSIYSDVRVASRLKEITESFTILVGTHVSALPTKTLKMGNIDAVARKEYDYTIRDLANTLKKNKKLKYVLGISYKKGKKIIHNPDRPFIKDLDKLPFVTSVYKKHLNIKDYFFAAAEYPMVMTMTGRGCPFRCFFCVDGNTLVIIKKDRKVFVKPIKDLIDPLLKTQSKRIGNHLVSEVNGIRILSDKRNFVKIKKVGRSVIKKKLYLIRLERGIYLKLTEDHLIPVKRGDKINVVKARDIKKGDKVKLLKPNFDVAKIKEINVYEEFLQKVPSYLLKNIYIHNLGEYFEYLKKLKEFKKFKKKISSYQWYNKILPLSLFSELVDKFGIPSNLSTLEIGGKNLKPIPFILKINKEFMELIGYFVAKGHYSKYNLVITQSNKSLIKKIVKTIKSLFPKTSITTKPKKHSEQIVFGGKLLYLFFKYVLDIPKEAKNKKLPWIVFNVEEKYIRSCLAALFTCGGSLDKRKIKYSSVSEVLINQIAILLSFLDVSPSLTQHIPEKATLINRKHKFDFLFEVHIASWRDRNIFLEKVGFLDKRKNKLEKFQKDTKPLKIKVLETLTFPKSAKQVSRDLNISEGVANYILRKMNHEGILEKKIIKNTIYYSKKADKENDSFLPVIEIKDLKIKKYVYDIETENHYFFANLLLIHNCNWPQVFHGRKYRLRSPENVVEEFEYVTQELPEVKEIGIEDDTFSADLKRAQKICKLLIEKGINKKIKWWANTRVNLDLKTMKLMKKAGCRLVIPGYESGVQALLNNAKKGITVKQSIKFTKNAKKAGLLIHGCFIFGLPGETRETIRKTIEFAKKLNPDTAQFFPLMVYPGTEAYEWAKRNNYLITEDFSKWLTKDGHHTCVINLPKLTASEIVKYCDKARKEFYLRKEYILYKIKQSLLNFEEAKRNLKSAKRFIKYLLR